MREYTRRRFLELSGGAALGAAGFAAGMAHTMTAQAESEPTKKVAPSETIVLGIVGVAGRGSHLLDWFQAHEDVRFGAVCDVYDKHRDRAVQMTGGTAKPYKDFRDLVENKDLDAVLVATPPHWHPLVSVAALEAGKDVYCEKPMCMTPREGRAMVKAARKNNRVTQVGTQIHATDNYRRVVELVRSGILGKLSAVHTVLSLNEAPDGIGNGPNTNPPDGLDWDMWLGPAQELPYNDALYNGGHHRYFAPLIGSWLHEMGPHIVDLPMWALRPGAPLSVSAQGGKFATRDMSTIPDTLEASFRFPEFVMTWSNMCANSHGLAFHRDSGIKRRLGVAFHGVNASLLADYDWHEVVAEGERIDPTELPEPAFEKSPGHDREFLNCIKSRALPSCDVESHYPLHVVLNLGNIAYKAGTSIQWDAEKEEIVGDKAANRLVTPDYRKPWAVPA